MAASSTDITRLLEPILRSLGLLLWDLEFKKEGPKWLLRVYVDRESGGVTLNDCEAVSRDLGTVLDVEDIINHPYTLEVSSPGLDRTLTRPEHYLKCLGLNVKIKTYEPVEGQKVLSGVLKSFVDDTVAIETAGGRILMLPLKSIAKAALELRL